MNDSTTLGIHRENERSERQRDEQEGEGNIKGTFLGGGPLVPASTQRRHTESMGLGVR